MTGVSAVLAEQRCRDAHPERWEGSRTKAPQPDSACMACWSWASHVADLLAADRVLRLTFNATDLLAQPTADEAEGGEREALVAVLRPHLAPWRGEAHTLADAVLAAGFRRRDPDAGLRERVKAACEALTDTGDSDAVRVSRAYVILTGNGDLLAAIERDAALATPPAPERNGEAS